MSRDKLFAAQFLAVAMFFLFLPGVSRPDSHDTSRCDPATALAGLSDSGADAGPSASSNHHQFVTGKDRGSMITTGALYTLAGSPAGSTSASGGHDNLVPVTQPIAPFLPGKGGTALNGNKSGAGPGVGSNPTGSGSLGAHGNGNFSGTPGTNPFGPGSGSLGTTDASAVMIIPEPAVLSLLILGVAFLLLRRVLTLR